MKVKVQVHSHDDIPGHAQVSFSTPDIAGGLMVLRLEEGAQLPPIGKVYEADFLVVEEEAAPAA